VKLSVPYNKQCVTCFVILLLLKLQLGRMTFLYSNGIVQTWEKCSTCEYWRGEQEQRQSFHRLTSCPSAGTWIITKHYQWIIKILRSLVLPTSRYFFQVNKIVLNVKIATLNSQVYSFQFQVRINIISEHNHFLHLHHHLFAFIYFHHLVNLDQLF